MKMNCNPQLISDNGVFKFIDNTDEVLKSRKIARLFERYRTYFSDFECLELSRELNYIELLQEVGAHFSVNRMLTAECYKQRMEKGLTFLEFNYMIMQAYDFWKLHKDFDYLPLYSA